MNRPGSTRPSTLPGMVTYPSRPGVGTGGRGPGNLNRPSTLPANRGNWNHNQWGGNRGVWGNGNDVNIRINNNFRNNYNFAHNPGYWGNRPWWGAGDCHGWHHGHWGYGWSSSYYHHHWWCDDDDFIEGIMWGIGVWSLGNMIYNMGYQSYHNPYPAPTTVQHTYVNYSEPVSVAAAAHPPGDESALASAEAKSNEALKRSRDAFAKADYMTASKALDEAIAATPGDVTLHEYRALVFFALAKYSDAAAVLNPVLASGPGWSWQTMIGFYSDPEAYNQQIRKLEDYTKATPGKADARFLLGYHYMVCGHMKEANGEFAKACELQPADTISRQLRDLTKSSLPATDDDTTPPAKPDLMTQAKLPGLWVSDRGKEGKVTFEVKPDGNYTWNYVHEGRSTAMSGTYSFDDKGLMVMSTDDTQMIVELVRKDDTHMKFTIIGAPDGDPGLEFTKG